MSYDFKARFNEEDFMGFVKNKMFPGSDFYWKRANYKTEDFALNRIKSITLLGRSEDFDLAIYDMTHESENDPKVSLTREAFRFMRQNVEASTLNALIIFRSNNSDNYRLSLLTTDYNNVGRKTEREISNPRRFSFYLGPDAKTKTPEQFLIKKGAISNLEDLKSRFSVEVVNKEFYSKIAELFYRFIDEAKYPNADRKKFFAVKLIGRIIFCWFLKKKISDAGKPLMPEELLSLESLTKHKNYFHSVLEPLFFEVLNTPVEKRRPEALLQIEKFAKSIPFLNGGLFEPDDDDKYQGTASYGVIEITDSWFHDLFELLEMYNFTINENTPVDVELSIDPEMLGRIFENLLAEINPETGESARKATGSFYTPREIVEYMVNESLKAYLLQKVEIDEETVDKLLNWSEEAPELSESQSNGILEALDKMKVLDPACGSGAFPMGILQKTALVLEKIDPQSINWIVKMVEKIPDSNIRKFVEDQLQKEDWSYVHKLGIIQKSIYGVDIQPIAVEISKLRFFLSLIIDSKIDDKEKNRGVKPLPNLETKFVCANTLIGLEKSDLEEEAKIMLPTIADTEKELFRTRNSYFTAHTKEEKNRIQNDDEKLRVKLLSILVENGFKEDVTRNALMLAAWNPYKHNEVAPFFDPAWMFGVKNGFDIVIGNPPYMDSELMTNLGLESERKILQKTFTNLMGNWDIYMAFFELGLALGKFVSFITPDKWLSRPFGKKFRENQMCNRLSLITRAGSKIFESATVDAIITLFIEKSPTIQAAQFVDSNMVEKLFSTSSNTLEEPYLIDFLFSKNSSIINKMDNHKKRLIDYAECENACATSDFYLVKDLIQENKNPDLKKYYKLINTGTIEKYGNKWSTKEISYGGKYSFPVVDKKAFSELLGRSYVSRAAKSKIIFKGLNLLDGCLDEYAEILPGKSTIVICSDDIDLLKFLLGILNSKPIIFYIKTKYASSSYCGGITFSKDMINNLPMLETSAQQKSIIELVNKILVAKESDSTADTRADEHKIDLFVYHLYGLTFEEAKIIDPELKEEEFGVGKVKERG